MEERRNVDFIWSETYLVTYETFIVFLNYNLNLPSLKNKRYESISFRY